MFLQPLTPAREGAATSFARNVQFIGESMAQTPDNPINLSRQQQREILVDLLSRNSVFPLSLAQRRLWFLDQLEPGNPVYNIPFGWRFHGNLDRSVLALSVREIVRRHEILRTTFDTDAGQPVQVVAANSMIEMPLVDLSNVDSSEREEEAYRIATAEARASFQLAIGPLLRLKLIRLSADDHVLVCVMHHIVCDGWSLGVFARDLSALYEQYSNGQPSSLVDLPIQYGDYAKWEREWVRDTLLVNQVEHWRQRLTGAPVCLSLPTDRPRPSEQTYDGANQVRLVPQELIGALTVVGRSQQATLFMVMLAVFKIVLHCCAMADDIVVGVPAASRGRVELEDLIGLFVNILPLRTNLFGDPHFNDFLCRVREAALDAFDHADLPFERLVEELNPPRTLSYNPIFQVMYSAVKAAKSPKIGGVVATPYVFNSGTSLFDLSMEFTEDTQNRSWIGIQYSTSLFDARRIARMLDHYLLLLEAIAGSPDRRISELAALLNVDHKAASAGPPPFSHDERHRASCEPQVSHHSDESVEPGNALEQILIRIWQRVLGVSKVGIRDDFFDLGGHSLLAAHLMSEVEKVVGRKIPLSTLFRSATIQSLAEVIRQGLEWTSDPLLMEIQAGNREFPFFAVAEAGVDTLGYVLLARHMGAEQSFYKLQSNAPVYFIGPRTIDELRTLAREYIGAMQAIQPKGPYFVGGMCRGAHIAEQIVLELEAHGHEVGLLVIIDTFVLQKSDIRWLARLHAFYERHRFVLGMPASTQFALYRQAVKMRLRQLLLHEKAQAVWPGRDFQPKQFRAPVLLFRAPKQPYYIVIDPEMGWGARSLGGVKTCIVKQAHMEMLREPAVSMIAQRLRDAMHESIEATLRSPSLPSKGFGT